MKNFKRDNTNRGRRNDRRDSRRPVMHKTTCSKCGKECEVPFKPTGEKPVFCDDCFRDKRSSEPRRFDRRDSRRNPRRDSRRFGGERVMHKAICDKCGKECEVPFKPSNNKPIYCSECFEEEGKKKGSNQSKDQFEAIDAKLDKILEALSSSGSSKKTEKKKTVKKEKPKKRKDSGTKSKAKPKKTSKSKAKKATTKKKKKS